MHITPSMRRDAKDVLRDIRNAVQQLNALTSQTSLTGPEANRAADLVGIIAGDADLYASIMNLEV